MHELLGSVSKRHEQFSIIAFETLRLDLQFFPNLLNVLGQLTEHNGNWDLGKSWFSSDNFKLFSGS